MSRRLTAVLIAFGIIASLLFAGADFFFHQPYYESWDMAANSLSVERARHFAQAYGPYSRWGFHHPGPAYFYALALGEEIFYDVLHLTPAPYNAQVLAQVCLSTMFYVAALAVFARRLTPRAGAWFWPLALLTGAAYFGGAGQMPSYDFLRGPSAFSSTWSAHEIVMPFLCLLAAGASVAAGDGRDLPLLAVAAGTLLHLHVAQPLFVVPVAALAGLGLVWNRRRRAETAGDALVGQAVAAGVILAAFALPLVLDLFRGPDSNLAAILHHLGTHRGEHKTLVKSAFYFLQFGACSPYAPDRLDFGHFDGAGAWAYLREHAVSYLGWLLAVGIVIAVAARGIRGTAGPQATRGRFLGWAGAFLAVSIVMTLIWGVVQDGEMFYYNSWLNFAIYYFGLLIVLAEFAARREAAARWPWIELPACGGVVAYLGAGFIATDRVRDAVPETTALLHASIQRALSATARGHGVASLVFPELEWPVAAALGLEMARAGRAFVVDGRWVNVFGRDHARSRSDTAVPWRFTNGPGAVPWRSEAPEALAGVTRELRGQLGRGPSTGTGFPMLDDARLSATLPNLFLHADQDTEIDFRRGGNAPDFQLFGWSDAEPWGTWSDGAVSILRFAPDDRVPGAGVTTTIELHAFVSSAAGRRSQRVTVRFDGREIVSGQLTGDHRSLVGVIPAATWNAAVGTDQGATLEFQLPDAAAPAALDRTGHSDDTRLLGVGVSRIGFRVTPTGGEVH